MNKAPYANNAAYLITGQGDGKSVIIYYFLNVYTAVASMCRCNAAKR